MKANRAVLRIILVAGALTFAIHISLAQDAEKPEASSCRPGQGCDWLTPEAERLEALAVNDKSPTFSLTLSPGTRNKVASEYRLGSDMWMTVVQTNLTKHDIYCLSNSEDYEATDEDGKPVEQYHRGNILPTYDCGIGPGGSIPHEILINRIFKFHCPGKYVIRVSRREPFLKDEKGVPLVVWSDPITITITG
jgi:hypothetical protein